MNLIKRIGLGGLIMGLALAATVATAADIPQELVPLAQELGCQNTAECAEKFDANMEQGITLAQKYNIYTPEQEKIASTFKTEVLERLRAVSQDNFEEEILVLANKILKEKPALAKTMGVTRQTVSAAETIVTAVKDAGVDIRTCQKSPEDLSREQLIACVKAGNSLSNNKGKSFEDYIPKENIKAKEAEQMLNLENSLLAGEYSGLGKINIEEAGQICLKSGSESITDCDQIAERFFGAEGVKELQKARNKNTQIKEYYQQGLEKMELVTPEGEKIIGKGAIKNACDKAFEGSNLGLARACGNFAVKNGYATQDEIEDGLKLLDSFSQKAQGVDFNDCRFNPESCREFLPDEFRPQFDSQFKIFKIMSESIGFDPSRCENTYDPDIGKRCLEGAKKALSQVEEIAKNSPEARRIVDEIKGHINEGERMTQRRDEFNQDSSRGEMSGPGGCQGPEACFNYCNQPANSAECISFGAKSQIFEQSSVIQRFNTVNERFNTPYPDPRFNQYPPYPQQPYPDPRIDPYPYPQQPYPDPRTDPGFNRYPYPQQPVGPSPECFAAISSGDFAKAKTACSSTTENYPRPIAEPFPICPYTSMPSPCGEGQMRQMASDAKGCMTYGACIAIENYKPIDPGPKPCPAGQYWNGNSCINQTTETYKQCDWSIDYLKMSTNTCVARSTCYIASNPDYSSQECQGVRGSTTPVPTVGSCSYSTQYWKASNSTCQPRTNCSDTTNSEYNSQECQGVRGMTTACSSGMWWDPNTQSCKSSTVPTVDSCSYSTQYWKALNSTCQPRTNCYDTTNYEYNSQECQGVRGTTTPITYGCGSMTTQATCQASPGCGWANGACGGTMTTNTCPSGQYWYYPPAGGAGYCMSSVTSNTCPTGYHPHSESGGFCMNSQENYSGTCYNSAGTATITCPQQTYVAPTGSGCGAYISQTSCSSAPACSWQNNVCIMSSVTGGTTCPSGQYWYTPPGGGAGYCSSTTTCSSGQYWNGTACVTSSSTSTGQCPSGQYWYTPPGGGAGYCSSTTTCSSGQYWNGTACVANTTTTDTASMSTACAQAGGTWNTSTSYCQMPTTTSNTTCSSGQYWNGSSCVSSTTTSTTTTCSSGQYWNGTACVASSTTNTVDPVAACSLAGGTWNGSTCQMPTTVPTCPSGQSWNGTMCQGSSSSDPATMCAQSGGTWTGSACQMAKSMSDQKAYFSYYQKQSGSLLAQVIGVFANLFK